MDITIFRTRKVLLLLIYRLLTPPNIVSNVSFIHFKNIAILLLIVSSKHSVGYFVFQHYKCKRQELLWNSLSHSLEPEAITAFAHPLPITPRQ